MNRNAEDYVASYSERELANRLMMAMHSLRDLANAAQDALTEHGSAMDAGSHAHLSSALNLAAEAVRFVDGDGA